jgi:hypothetical protein
MDDREFDAQLKFVRRGLERLDLLIKDVLKEGVDVITIPGVKGKVLAQPGAEKLCLLARLIPTYRVQRTARHEHLVGDAASDEPDVHYLAHCDLHLGSAEGPVVGQAAASANNFEPRYRYRDAQKSCPECGAVGTLRKSKWEGKEGSGFEGVKPWYCYDKLGGCGKEFAPDDRRVTEQRVGRIENPDPMELDNTLLKMACKRALTSAVKGATGGSARFTVDLDDNRRDPQQIRQAQAEVLDDEAAAIQEMRDDLVSAIAALAKEKGFAKRGDLYRHLAERFKLAETPKNFDAFTNAQLSEVFDDWKPVEAKAEADDAIPF